MHPHQPFDHDARMSRLQRVSYNMDSDRLPPSASSSACSTPRSFSSYNGSLIGASNGRSQIPADVQSPAHVVAQIRDAHKHMLALSRNNFAKTPNDAESYPQSPALSRSSWQNESDAQQDPRSLDSISELSDSRYQQEHFPLNGVSQPDVSHSSERELRQQNERLSRQLVAANHDREKQQQEHFKLRQEQQLQFEDLRQHVSSLEVQLQESQSSTGELLEVNNFLDAELKKHKAWLDQSQETSGHYRHLFKQEEHEKQQLSQQLHETQAQLADTWRESSHKQELLAELQGQTSAAADHQARAKELSTANRKLDITNGQLMDAQQMLEDSKRDLEFQLDGLRSALTDAFQEHEAAQKTHAEQQRHQAAEHSRLESQSADINKQLEQAHHELHGMHASQAHQEAESAARMAQLSNANEQLQQQISILDTQLGQTEQELHQARQSNTAKRAQQASQEADRLAELQGRNTQLERRLASLEEECSAKGSQVRQLLKLQEQFEISEAARQAQHVGNAGVIADLTAANHQLQAQVTSLSRQLEQTQTKQHRAEDLKAAQQAQRAAADAANTEDIANLTQVNGQLMAQVSQLSTQLEQTQTVLQDVTSAKHAEQADAVRSFSHDDQLQLQEQVSSLNQQLEQAQGELHLTQTQIIAQHGQQPENVGANTASGQGSGDLLKQTSSLSRQLEQTQHELHHVQDSSAAQHAQQAADSTEDITDLTEANGRLMEQVAESQAQTAQAQHQADAAAKQLQHMRELVKVQHAKREEHAASLQAKLDDLSGECQAKDKQVQELQAQLETAQGSIASQSSKHNAAANDTKLHQLTNFNGQLEDHVASLDLQLEQTQEELDQTQEELDQTQKELTQALQELSASQADLQQQTELAAAQRAQHDELQHRQAASKPWEEECVAKALQVQQLLTQVDQLTDDREALDKQVQYLNQQIDYLSDKSDQKDAQVVQLTGQLEALQQEHHRLTASHLDQEKQNGLLQEECAQLQTYISALDEDLGKAQARMDGILSADGTSTSRQHEMLKAAAKQVIQIQARDGRRSRVPRLLRKFSTRKKDKSSSLMEEDAFSEPHPQIHPISPRAAPVSRTVSGMTMASQDAGMRPNPVSRTVSGITVGSQDAGTRLSQDAGIRANPVSRTISGITTVSQDVGAAVKEASENGSSGGVTGPLTPSEQAPSAIPTEAPPEYHRLKEENSDLAQKLAQANRDMAELNSRLVNAAFGSAFSGALPEMFKPSVSGLDHTDCSSQLDRQSSNPAGSSSGEQASIAGLPPGIPLDPFYDE